jgi:hypothetical protein
VCSDLIDCCGTETSIDGFRKCIKIISNAMLENADETPANKTDQPGLLACPDTCTNKPLCDCIRAYYTDGEETCLSIELSACRKGEFATCVPVDSSKDFYVGQDIALAYRQCSLVECLDLGGVKSAYDNMTLTYSCYCESYTSWCKNCYEIQDSNPYCNWLLTSYEGMCSGLIDCCAMAANTEDVRKCKKIVLQGNLENQDAPVNKTQEVLPIADIVNNISSQNPSDSNTDSDIGAESIDQSSSFGLKSDDICTVTVLASAVVFAEVMM